MDEEKNDRGWFMVRVNDPRKTIWDFFIILTAIYNCFSIPLQIAFEPPILETAPFETANNIIDFLFVLDILIAFRTTYYDLETGDEIFQSNLVISAYVKSRFFVDLISTIPIDTIVYVLTK